MPIRRKIVVPLPASCSRPDYRLFVRGVMCAVMLAALLAGATQGQAQPPQPPPQTGSSPGSQAPAEPAQTAPMKVPGASLYNFLQRKSIVFPDIALSAIPLSPGQKFELAVDNSISVHSITWSMLGAAVGQADDSPTGFGQGWDAYAKRFGSSMARQASGEFFGTFVLASALHEDPRFYAEIKPSFFHAIKYSVQRVFITRNDSGQDVTNWSGLTGPLMAEGLANAYWPERNRTAGDTLFRYGLDLAGKAGGNMLREYWPVFYGKLHHAPRPASEHK